jgi:hypothetical protein
MLLQETITVTMESWTQETDPKYRYLLVVVVLHTSYIFLSDAYHIMFI